MTEKSKEACWYVVHTYSGYENKVKDTLEKSVENNGMQDLIFDVRVPVEDVVEIRNGKRVKTNYINHSDIVRGGTLVFVMKGKK